MHSTSGHPDAGPALARDVGPERGLVSEGARWACYTQFAGSRDAGSGPDVCGTRSHTSS